MLIFSVSHVIKYIEFHVNATWIHIHAIQELIITVLQQINHLNCTEIIEYWKKCAKNAPFIIKQAEKAYFRTQAEKAYFRAPSILN